MNMKNIPESKKAELLEAAENTKGAEAFVLLIGYEDGHSLSTIVGGGGNVLSLLTKAIDHILSDIPEPVGKDLRMKMAELILRGEDDASE